MDPNSAEARTLVESKRERSFSVKGQVHHMSEGVTARFHSYALVSETNYPGQDFHAHDDKIVSIVIRHLSKTRVFEMWAARAPGMRQWERDT